MKIKDAIPIGRAILAFILAVLCGGGSLWLGQLPVEEKMRPLLFLGYWLAVAVLFLGADFYWQRRMLAPSRLLWRSWPGGKPMLPFPCG